MVVVGTYKEPLLVERTFGENHPKDLIYRQLHKRLKENSNPKHDSFLTSSTNNQTSQGYSLQSKRIFIVPPQAGSDPQAGRAPQLA